MFKNSKNMINLLSQTKKIKENMEKLRITASSSGNLVTITKNSSGKILSVKIDPSIKNEDIDLIEDLILDADNNCQKKLEEEISNITKSLGGIGSGLF